MMFHGLRGNRLLILVSFWVYIYSDDVRVSANSRDKIQTGTSSKLAINNRIGYSKGEGEIDSHATLGVWFIATVIPERQKILVITSATDYSNNS